MLTTACCLVVQLGPWSHVFMLLSVSGAETNLKVGGEGTCPAQSAWKIFLVVPLFFGSTSTISRFGERFCDDRYSLVSFLFAVLLLTVSPLPSHLWKWGYVHRYPVESVTLLHSSPSSLHQTCWIQTRVDSAVCMTKNVTFETGNRLNAKLRLVEVINVQTPQSRTISALFCLLS